MSNAKKRLANSCNIVGVLLLNVAIFSLVIPTAALAASWSIAVVAVSAIFIGTMLLFQVMFQKWEAPNVSFSMKQVGSIREQRRERYG